mmetsp:Transcript_39725/g.60890  ORF Transcript_39725/g.60890 Transcript_39725/m.60890 type:complete len:161 (-) Transcript_39725:215-697(-)
MKRSSNNDDLDQEVSITLDIPKEQSSVGSDFKQLNGAQAQLMESKTKKTTKLEQSGNIFSQFLMSGSKEKTGNFISKLTKSSLKKPNLLEEEEGKEDSKMLLIEPTPLVLGEEDLEAEPHPLSEENYEDKNRRETTFKNETDSFESQMDEFLLIGAKSDQ